MLGFFPLCSQKVARIYLPHFGGREGAMVVSLKYIFCTRSKSLLRRRAHVVKGNPYINMQSFDAGCVHPQAVSKQI